MPDRLEVLAAEVELDVPEAVDVERRSRGSGASPNVRLGQVEPDELVDVERRAELAGLDAGGEVRGGRREDVAAVEGARDRLEHGTPGSSSSCAASTPPRRSAAGTSRPLSGPTKRRPSPLRSASARRLAPTPGSTTARWTPLGHVRKRVREHERALEHGLRRDPVRDVDHLRVGRDPLDHAVADADEVVLRARSRSGR